MVIGDSRTELLEWLNLTLGSNYTKIESCGTGAPFCQLMDLILGGVSLNKIKYDANTEYDYRFNWKILQNSFNKHNITKIIDVEKLIKCRLQDNLELLQWFKRFWIESKGNNFEQNLNVKKKNVMNNGSIDLLNVNKNTSKNNQSKDSFHNPVSSNKINVSNNIINNYNDIISTNNQTKNPSVFKLKNSNYKSNNILQVTENKSENKYNAKINEKVLHLNKKLDKLNNELNIANDKIKVYKCQIEVLNSERSFYFNKLREIEILFQNIMDFINESKEDDLKDLKIDQLIKKVFSILYSKEKDISSDLDFKNLIKIDSPKNQNKSTLICLNKSEITDFKKESDSDNSF